MKTFTQKTVLITGGSSGIGYALAEEFIKSGANVWLLARREELLKESAAKLTQFKINEEQQILTLSGDVSDYSSLETLLNNIMASQGTPDILINSAGIAYPGEFLELDPEIFDKVMRINYLGTVNTIKVIAPKMVAQKNGHIVNISSLAGIVPIYGYTAYAPSKYAVNGFSQILKTELTPHNVKVSVVYPPDTDTPQLEFENSIKPEITKAITAGGGLLSAEKVAQVIIRGIRKGKYHIIPGTEGKFLKALAPIVSKVLHLIAVSSAKKRK